MTRRRGLIAVLAVAYTLARPIAALAQCPSPDIEDVLRDEAVQDALDRAWRDSHEGTEGEHEEGGDIYQCREALGDGAYRYYTDIRPWPPGTSEEIDGGRWPVSDSTCRHVGTYHTHPGGAGDDGHDNHRPSGEDELASANEGVPGIIRWGHDGDTHDFTYGYNRMTAPRDLSWGCPRDPAAGGGDARDGEGETTGDPHLRSLDGLRFDFQAIGDFVLVRSQTNDFEVHVRQQPYRSLTHVSPNAAVVVRDGRDRIEWGLGRAEPLLNGTPRAIGAGEVVRLRSYAVLRRDDDGYALMTAAGDRVRVALNGPYVDVRVRIAPQRKGAVSGLLGNLDGDRDNDVRSAGGEAVVPPQPREGADYTHPLYTTFGASWRVPAGTRLFAEPFTSSADPGVFPARVALPPETAFAAAADRCAARGVTHAEALANCAYDLAVTGDEAFIMSGAQTHTAYAVPLIPPPPAAAPPAAPTPGGAAAADRDVSGTIDRPDQRVEYTIELNRGAYVFDARGSSGTWWTLTTPDRKTPFNSNQSAYMGRYPVRLLLTRAGSHVITVGVQPNTPSGSYRFRVHTVPATPERAIAIDDDVSGRIASIGEEHVYRLPLTRGVYAFDASTAENTSWELRSPNGRTPFDGNQETYMHSVRRIELPSGPYTLTIRGRSVLGVGAYRFRVTRVP